MGGVKGAVASSLWERPSISSLRQAQQHGQRMFVATVAAAAAAVVVAALTISSFS